MTARVCPHHECREEIPAHLFSCKPHWLALPVWIRRDITTAWRRLRTGEGTRVDLEAAQRRAIHYWQRPLERRVSR